jgi:hypothetical protein
MGKICSKCGVYITLDNIAGNYDRFYDDAYLRCKNCDDLIYKIKGSCLGCRFMRIQMSPETKMETSLYIKQFCDYYRGICEQYRAKKCPIYSDVNTEIMDVNNGKIMWELL